MKYTLQFEHISSVELQKLIEFLSLHKYDFSPLPNDGKPHVSSSVCGNCESSNWSKADYQCLECGHWMNETQTDC